MDWSTSDFIAVSSLAMNLIIGYLATKTRAEVAELKVWIYENFERRKEDRIVIQRKHTVTKHPPM